MNFICKRIHIHIRVHVLHSTKYLRVKSVQSISHKVGNRKAYGKYYRVLYSIFYNKRTVCILFTFSFPEKDKQIDWHVMAIMY